MLKRLAILCLAVLTSACGGGSDASFDNGNARLLTAIEVNPADSTIAAGQTQAYAATGVYSDGSEEDISARVSWSSSDTALAGIDSTGVATGLAAGSVRIAASLEGVNGDTGLTVTDAVAQLLQIIPPAASIPLNTTQDYRAFAVYSDGSVENVTFGAQWELANGSGILAAYDPGATPASAELDDFGTAIGVAVGEDQLVARFAGLSSSSNITVTEAALVSLSVTPAQQTTPAGTLIAYTATGNYSDGSTANLTKAVTWSSSDPTVATISNGGATRGLAAALSAGTTEVQARFEGLSGEAQLTVLADAITRLDLLPARAGIDVGETLQYQAIAITEQGRSLDVTSGADWTSINTSVAAISEDGKASGVTPGITGIEAAFRGITGSAELTVRAPQISLVAINLEPVNATLYSFTSLQFAAIGIYSDGSNADITERATWSTAERDVLVVSNDEDFGRGLGFGLQPGDTTISASLDGVSGSTPVRVIERESALLELVVTPAVFDMPVGASTVYTADLVIPGERALDVSEFVAWSSGNADVASIDALGITRALSEGQTVIEATLQLAGFTLRGSGVLRVSEAAPNIVEVAVSPSLARVVEGGQQQYSARAIYSDGSSQDVSQQVDWRTGDAATAVIDLQGLATGVNADTTQVIARLTTANGPLEGAATLEVFATTAPSIIGLSVTPPKASTLPQGNAAFTAIANYQDGTTEDVSDSVSWLSSDPAVAQVDSGGLATGIAPGASDISATLVTSNGSVSDSGRLTVNTPEVTIDELIVDPSTAEVLVGGKQAFMARVLLSDGTEQDVTSQVSWTSGDPGIASINGQGRATGIAEGVVAITATLNHEGAGYQDSAELTVTPAAVTIDELLVDPASATVLTGGTQAFSARVILSDGSSQDVTGDVSWSSSDSTVAQVDASGLATGLNEGRSEIIATLRYEGSAFSDSGRLTVEAQAVTVDEVRVQPPKATVFVGGQQQYTAEAVLSNGTTVDVTRDASWQSGDSGIATVNTTGRATGVLEGTTTVAATISYLGESFSGDATITVNPPEVTLDELIVEPAQSTVLLGSTQQFTARAIFSDGSDQNVTEQVAWSSSDSGVASVDAAGLARGLGSGAADIVARLNVEGTQYSDSSRLRVEAPAPIVTDLRVEPASAEILIDTRQQFQAFAELSNGTTIEVTGDVSWNSSDEGIAHINNSGRATGLAEGVVDITASLTVDGENYRDSAPLSVLPLPVTALELIVTPEAAEIIVNSTQQYKAVALLSDGSQADVSDDVDWSSADNSVAQVNSSGLAAGLAEGTTSIRAVLNYGDGQLIEDRVDLVVKPPAVTVDSIDVDPQAATILAGEQQVFTATANLSDGSLQDVSSDVTWTSSDQAVADVDSNGVATGYASGIADITATLPTAAGPLSDSGVLTVEAGAQITTLQIFPAVASLPLGSTEDFRAFAFYDDGRKENVTFEGTWSLTAEPPILERYEPGSGGSSNAIDDFGTAIGVLVGEDDLQFEYQGLATSAEVAVTEAVLVELSISPRDQSVSIGAETQYSASGVYSDGGSRDITDAVTWSSSDAAVAFISNSSPSRGIATALTLGMTTITASLDGITDSTVLRVNSDPVVRLDVSPPQQTIPEGAQQQYQATAVYTSGLTEDATSEADWSSSDDSIATVNASGLADGVAAGTAVISADFAGVSGETSLTVEATTDLVNISVEPVNSTLLPLQTVALTATAFYSDQSSRDVTGEVTWTSLNPENVAISNDPGIGSGLALALRAGEATIRAAMPGEPDATAGTANITVVPLSEVVDKLEVNPPVSTILVSETQQYEAVLVFDNGESLDATNYASWTTVDSDIASIDGTGLAHGEAAGTAIITATLPNTSITGQAQLNVRDPITIDTIVVSPPTAEVLEGDNQTYIAVAQLSNGEEVDVTGDVDWSTGNGAVAQIAPGGLATGISEGTTSIVATLDIGGSLTQGEASITVLPLVTIEEIIVSPPRATILEGDQQQFLAEARLSDGRAIDITATATWQSSDNSVAQIAPGGLATGKEAGNVAITASFSYEGTSYDGTAQLLVTAVTVESIQVTPKLAQTVSGGSVQFTASATMTDLSVRDITSQSTWFVSDDNIAYIESGANAGLATGFESGTTTVYIEYSEAGETFDCLGDAQCPATLEVLAPSVTEIQVTPAVAEIPVGEAVQYTATALLDNGNSVDATSYVSWRSSDTLIASMNPTGSAAGISPGLVEISATLVDGDNSFTDAAELTVTAPPINIEDLRVTPENITILNRSTQQYTATALLSDGKSVDVTDKAAWSSSDSFVAHIESSGLATGLAEGSTTITAAVNFEGTETQGSTRLTVEEPLEVVSLEVTPRSAELLTGDSLQYRATATFSDDSVLDVTNQSLWLTGDPSIATIASGGNAGLATAASAGAVNVWAEFTLDGTTFPCEGNSACEATLTVADPVTAVRLDVSPTSTSIILGSTAQFTAELVLSDGNVLDVSGEVAWSSSDPDIATVQEPGGLFIGLAEGTTTVSATGEFGGTTLSDTATLTVEPVPVTVDRLEVVPAAATVFVGDNGNFEALAYLSNGDVQDVTAESVWRSSDTSVGVIDPDTGFGLALSTGQTTVSASFIYQDQTSVGESQVSVTEAQPDLLEVAPAITSLAAGDTQQYTATLHYEDGREELVTDSVSWSSTDTTVAIVSNAPGSKGEASALAEGSTRIRATHESGLVADGFMDVIAPSLVSLQIEPAATDLVEGEVTRLFALATFSDESVLDVSDQADWSSDDNAVASVDNGESLGGVLSGNSAGQAIVTAAYQGFAATSTVTVAANALVNGWIEPASNTMEIGEEQDYRAFGEFLDGSNREITFEAVWQTSNPAVATVGNDPDSQGNQPKGRVLALAEGNTDISATFDGATVDSSPLTVLGLETVALELTPTGAELLPGGTAGFIADATFSDNSTKNVTDFSIWSTDNADVAVVSNATGSQGTVTATGPGDTQVSASYDGLSASAPITVGEGECVGRPTSIVIDAGDQTVPEGQTVRFTARGFYDDGCNQDITESNQTVWRSNDKKICDFNSPKGGEATGLKEGVATVEATHRGRTDEATCTVTPRED